jgi:hypothetical protein
MKISAFTFTHLESKVVGYVAHDIGTSKPKFSGGPAGPIADVGKYMAILKHTDGAWKVAYLIVNSDLPPKMPPRRC